MGRSSCWLLAAWSYCTRSRCAAATDRMRHPPARRRLAPRRGQRRGHRLGARQSESQGGGLSGRVVRGGIAVAGYRDDAVPRRAASCLRLSAAKVCSSAEPVTNVTLTELAEPVGLAGRCGCRRCRSDLRGCGRWRRLGFRMRRTRCSRPQEPTMLWLAERPAGWVAPGARLAVEVAPRPGRGGGWRRGTRRGKRRALHRTHRCLGRRCRRLASGGWLAGRRRGRRCLGGRHVALAVAVPGGDGGGGGGTVPRPNSAGEAPGTDGSAIGAAAATCCALRPIGDQRAGDVGERRAVRLRRLRRHSGQVGIRLVGAGRRRPLLGDLAAFQAMPPAHRVYRRGTKSNPPAAAHTATRH